MANTERKIALVESAPTVGEEQRVVVILDLVGSTGMAERLGSVRFHALLSDVFARLARLVVEHGGEVQSYVGDALIATWAFGAPHENARAVRCVFECRAALELAACEMLRRHGEVPQVRAAAHGGPLVAAEIGGLRRAPVLVGDAMNTAARIEEVCSLAGHGVLVSGSLLESTAMPSDVVATSIGRHALRGKARELELFALAEGWASAASSCPMRACA